MRWNPFRLRRSVEAGRAARAAHSVWLTRAFGERREYPRIPARRVDDGGFSELLATAEGRRVVEWWWEHALAQVDVISRERSGR
ncbi:MAG: hypothetical protein KF866_03125 [Phycisphaeraceae bacterium]|nr:hypothetical protein [Phycisphaeraceae bacterium]MCW5753311.1 hypothetical protein [Phycisphaeraceae bacterium]